MKPSSTPPSETHREKVRRLYRERKAVDEAAAAEIAKREIARIATQSPYDLNGLKEYPGE